MHSAVGYMSYKCRINHVMQCLSVRLSMCVLYWRSVNIWLLGASVLLVLCCQHLQVLSHHSIPILKSLYTGVIDIPSMYVVLPKLAYKVLKCLNKGWTLHQIYLRWGWATWGPGRPFTVSDAFGLAIDPQFFDNSNTKGSRFSSTCLSAYLYQFVSLQPSGSTRHHHALDHPLFNLFKITISLVSICDNATALESTSCNASFPQPHRNHPPSTLLILSMTAHLFRHHHCHHSSLSPYRYSFTPDSKLASSTNPSHHWPLHYRSTHLTYGLGTVQRYFIVFPHLLLLYSVLVYTTLFGSWIIHFVTQSESHDMFLHLVAVLQIHVSCQIS